MSKITDYTVTEESFTSLAGYQSSPAHNLRWDLVFTLPVWLEVWWRVFGAEAKPYLAAVRQGEAIIGIAPLLIKENVASIVGGVDVCDYLDFVIAPGREKDFFNILLDNLKQKGINNLELKPLRPDSTVLTHLAGIAKGRGYEVLTEPEDVSLDMDLPASWEEYLATLDVKQSHEIRRKLRKLSASGEINYYVISEKTAVNQAMDTFLKMFTESRTDKANFLTGQMETFFRSLVDKLSGAGLLKLGVLELDKLPVAMVLYFDYKNNIYLYNSGYDPKYDSLSAGLICKLFCIKESIQEGKKKFDFLKGNETYKYHLGGKVIPLSHCQINIK
ncbi:MAG: GNAT family N-acetyltransferase [Chloroflexota bacterium]